MGFFGPGSGDPNAEIEITGSLTSTQIKALFSGPPVLVAGVSGKAYWVIASQIVIRAGGTPYTTGHGQIRIGAPAAGVNAAVFFFDDIFLEASDAIAYGGSGGISSFPLSDADGADLVIFDDTANPAAGDGTLDWWVRYRVTDV
jgi:hypothetical protein